MAWAGSSTNNTSVDTNLIIQNDALFSIDHNEDDLCEIARIQDIDPLDEASGFPSLGRVDFHAEDGNEAQLCPDLAGTTPTQSDFSPNRFQYSKMTATTPSPQRTGVSPSSSPRLPSPPPFTEVQIGPKSPTIRDGPENQLREAAKHDDGSTRRIRPGTRAADMASGPPLIPLADLESPFQLQEHLKALYHTHTRGPNDTITPITRQTALTLSTPPVGIDKPLWLYELCRFLTMKANNLIIAFFADTPPCSASTCPEMRASEWQYLCAVHDPPKSCCAIDYCCHTLDWAANILTSPKYFPSRLTLGGDMGGAGGAGGSQASMRHLTNIFRRVYRIFAHAWFQHRGVFWQVEGHEGLYVFFKMVCDVYQLIPEDNYTIPHEAEGDEDSMETPVEKKSPETRRLNLMKKNEENENLLVGQNGDGEATTTVSVGATTRRHKHTPSTGSHVTTIAEGLEEEDPSFKEADEKDSPEPSELSGRPRGRPIPPGEDIISKGLGKLSLGDLGASKNDGAAEQPTPQPQSTEKNPIDDLANGDVSMMASEAAVAGAAAGIGGEEKEGRQGEEKQNLDTSDTSRDLGVTRRSTVVTATEVDGKDEEEESENAGSLEGTADNNGGESQGEKNELNSPSTEFAEPQRR